MAVPKIRFQGFTEDWEQRKLSGMATFSKGSGYSKADLKTSGKPIILYGRMYTKYETIIRNVDTFAEEKAGSVYSESGDVIVPASGETAQDISRASVVANSGILLGGDINIIHPNNELNPGFLALTISNGNQQKKLSMKAQGATIVHLHNEDLKGVDILCPSIDEQTLISEFFERIDNTITLHQRKLESMKLLKKSLLQKMFPKSGETVPEVRFPGFTDAWEQRKLGEIGQCQSGVGFPDAEQGGTTGIPFFKVSDMNNPGNETEMVNANNYVTEEQIARKKWKPITEVPAMFFAKVGAAVLLNRKRLVSFPFLLDNNTMAYKFSSKWDARFGKAVFETIYLPGLAQTGALPSYNARDVENISIFIPATKEEQVRIGGFFKTIDDTITLHQRKVEALQKLKKSLLQQMFV